MFKFWLKNMEFNLIQTDSKARACELKTAHSIIKTPVFMPVGTIASVKSLDSNDLIEKIGSKIILANTYHTYLRPSDKLISALGGLHKFCNYKYSFLTDSGGYQAFSLGSNVKSTDDGIEFKSHIDGSKHFFSPKKVIDIQYNLNSDIMMVLDDLVSSKESRDRLKLSIQRTYNWAKESLTYHKENERVNNNIFAIIQGGVDKEYRKISATKLCELDFDGFAIGGLSVGEENILMYDIVEFSQEFMPKNKPRYLMGVGTPEDLVECIDRGIDMFDCVMPTRNARNGTLFTSYGKINIRSNKYNKDDISIDELCNCFTCKNYTKAYLNHLYRAKELSYFRLASIHNLHYYKNLTDLARQAILEKRYKEFKKDFYARREV